MYSSRNPMSLFQQRFKLFFERNKVKLEQREIIICIGNEGCDLDSFISSLVIAYAEDVIHVVNMRKEVFVSKGELMHVCNLFKIDVDDLIYLERPLGNMSLEAKKIATFFLAGKERVSMTEKRISLFLTDHNEPVRELEDYEITMIIDHHRLEHIVKNAKRIYVDVDVGSATTLVSKYLGHDLSRKNHCANDPRNTDPDKDTLCVSIAKFLIIPIIIDTKNLKRRTSMFDYYEYRKLKKKAGLKVSTIKEQKKILRKVRLNDANLPSEIILQKDFKQYFQGRIIFGIATVKFSFEKWADREAKKITGINDDMKGLGLFIVLNEFRKRLGLDFLLVGYKSGERRSYIIINFPLIDYFSEQEQFSKLEYAGLEYYDVPVDVSRKIISPRIRKFLNEKVIR